MTLRDSHQAGLDVPGRAIRVAGVAALGRFVMHGVVTPIKCILGCNAAHSLLLLVGLWRVLQQVLLHAN